MKPARFEYFRPTDASEAVALMAQFDGEARFLAGGQSLIPLLNFRVLTPAALIDISRCAELDYLRCDGNVLAFGPMTRQAFVEDSQLVGDRCPLLSFTMPLLGPRTVRNRATIGGTMAHADRVAELPAVAVALGAEFVCQSPRGRRSVGAEDFFVGDLTTSMEPDEMLREIRFPAAQDDARVAFVKATNRHHDLALVGIAVSFQETNGKFDRPRLAVHGIGPRPQRLKAVETALQDRRIQNDAIQAAAKLSLDGLELESDGGPISTYRQTVLPGLVERAVDDAVRRTRRGRP